MFINTTDTVIKAVMNIEHCSQNLGTTLKKEVCSHTSSCSGLWPWCCSNPVLHSCLTLSLNTCSLLHRCITCFFACEHKNPSLSARFLAVTWLPHHLLDARCIAVRRLPHCPLNACCITVRRLHRHPLFTHCVSMRTLPMHFWTLVIYSIFRFSILPHSSRQRYLSLSLEGTKRIWWSVPLIRRHWHSRNCDVRGFTGCILLGATASCYNIFGN
jgi:hypothetical protein